MAGKTDMFGCMVHGGGRKMANGMGSSMGNSMGRCMGRCMNKCLSGKTAAAPRMRGGFAGRGDPIGRANGLGDLGHGRGRNKRTSWF